MPGTILTTVYLNYKRICRCGYINIAFLYGLIGYRIWKVTYTYIHTKICIYGYFEVSNIQNKFIVVNTHAKYYSRNILHSYEDTVNSLIQRISQNGYILITNYFIWMKIQYLHFCLAY